MRKKVEARVVITLTAHLVRDRRENLIRTEEGEETCKLFKYLPHKTKYFTLPSIGGDLLTNSALEGNQNIKAEIILNIFIILESFKVKTLIKAGG